MSQTTSLTQEEQLTKLLEHKNRFVAHRGLSVLAPENSMAALQLAAEHGFTFTETDFSTTADGEWVSMHDATVDRMTNGTGLIRHKTLDEIKKLVITGGNNADLYPAEVILTFSEYLAACSRLKLIPFLEIKPYKTYPDQELDDFCAIIKTAGFIDKATIICFDYTVLMRIRLRLPHIKLQFLSEGLSTEIIEITEKITDAGLDVSYHATTPELLQFAHTKGMQVTIWTVDDVENANHFIDMGVDYITSNCLPFTPHEPIKK